VEFLGEITGERSRYHVLRFDFRARDQAPLLFRHLWTLALLSTLANEDLCRSFGISKWHLNAET
jgi:hypothetical protein